jgi:transcriptional regulator GlxA family with amidase domain
MLSAAQIADELMVDVRTLRRHLVAEGTSFQELRDLGLSVTEVARRLGYAVTSVFSHAFKRLARRLAANVPAPPDRVKLTEPSSVLAQPVESH